MILVLVNVNICIHHKPSSEQNCHQFNVNLALDHSNTVKVVLSSLCDVAAKNNPCISAEREREREHQIEKKTSEIQVLSRYKFQVVTKKIFKLIHVVPSVWYCIMIP